MMFFYLIALAYGFISTINRMLNVKASEILGATNGSLLNYIEATIISLVLIFCFSNSNELRISHIASVPVWFYLGSVCGLVAMILLVISAVKTGAMLSTILLLFGQMGTAVLIDSLFFNEFNILKILGILFIIIGVCWRDRLKSDEDKNTYLKI